MADTANRSNAIVTAGLFEAYLKCPTKCFLRSVGDMPGENEFAVWYRTEAAGYTERCVAALVTKFDPREVAPSGFAVNQNSFRSASWSIAVDCLARTERLESRIAAVERIPAETRGRPREIVPARFVSANKITREDKLLAAFDAYVLSEAADVKIAGSRLIHGDRSKAIKVDVSCRLNEIRKLTQAVGALILSASPPELMLNRHCAECEFQIRCRTKAIEKDDLSLLAKITKNERRQLASKGIFTITQLSYTFRPRRRPKHLRDSREKYHHALKALAIRERKIHIVNSPHLAVAGTPVFLDVECVPDRDFYYLIGMRVLRGDSASQHTFWADTADYEINIWIAFLKALAQVDNPLLLHYGSFEETFLKRMQKRHTSVFQVPASLQQTMAATVNVLAFIYGQIYFPTYSNGLKEIAAFLGFRWPSDAPSGPVSVVCRQQWERTAAPELRDRLIAYNSADCEGLEIVTKALLRLPSRPLNAKDPPQDQHVAFVTDGALDAFSHPSWKTFEGTMPELDEINRAAQWDYQRDRIYLRDGKRMSSKARPRERMTPGQHRTLLPDFTIPLWKSPVCPKCQEASDQPWGRKKYLVNDLFFGRSSVKRRSVNYELQKFRCPRCKIVFGYDDRYTVSTTVGWNLVALNFFMLLDLGVSERSISRLFERLFDTPIGEGTAAGLKVRVATYYAETVAKIQQRIVAGPVIYADETRARLHGSAGYVWVFAGPDEVVYLYSKSREGDILNTVLKDFHGVLVSDFYSAYDSVDCPQQKCLIHLIRDFNNEILSDPYDEELKQFVRQFAGLIRPMIETIDQHGLRRRYLNKHLNAVNRFYRNLSRSKYSSEVAIACKHRCEKCRGKLFTFLHHDGVAWNNNYAEHAIKSYAKLRRNFVSTPSEGSISRFLVLMSIYQTCHMRGIDFLSFLCSGERDIQTYVESRQRKSRSKSPTPSV
jgi:predicted RecB family nuclease